MTLASLLTRPATLVRRSYDGAEDEFGDPTWSEVAEPVNVEIQPAGATEALEGQVSVASYRLFLPADVALAGWDAVKLGDDVYEIEGEPAEQWNPLAGAVSHVEALATKVR